MNPMEQHGAFSWCELMTDDVAGAKQFYGGVFGWEMELTEAMGRPYTLIRAGGATVGGIMDKPVDKPEMPTMWGTYVTVDDVDACVAKATELGGKILCPAMDIPGVGRFAWIADPKGAALGIITYEKRG